jgi:hypothetical protein
VKINRRLIEEFSMFIAISVILIWAMDIKPPSMARKEGRSQSRGRPQESDDLELLELEPDPWWVRWILGDEEGKHPVWWTDFWAGVGTLLMVAAAIALIVGAVIGGIWVYHHQPLFLLAIPAIPMIAFFGHFARDIFWSDAGHKH